MISVPCFFDLQDPVKERMEELRKENEEIEQRTAVHQQVRGGGVLGLKWLFVQAAYSKRRFRDRLTLKLRSISGIQSKEIGLTSNLQKFYFPVVQTN